MKRIAVATGTRAEYGLLRELLVLLDDDPDVDLRVVATAMHLSPEFGLTYRFIEEDGFRIDEKVQCLHPSDTPVGAVKSTGAAMVGFADALERIEPDALVVLGDRFEILAAATAAFMMGIPVVHIGGGDRTEGAMDDSLRHAVTKMSALHLVATDEHARRVCQLGEDPETVATVGALGLDAIAQLEPVPRDELEADLGIRFGDKTAVVAFHPVTLEPGASKRQFQAMVDGLERVDGLSMIFTQPNADPEGRALSQRLDKYVATHPERATSVDSMGHQRFLSAMREADVVVGNSSAGIVEAPACDTPSVNVGNRQAGRARAACTLDAAPTADAVEAAVREALTEEIQNLARVTESPYGDGHAAQRIREAIAGYLSVEHDAAKSFRDMEWE